MANAGQTHPLVVTNSQALTEHCSQSPRGMLALLSVSPTHGIVVTAVKADSYRALAQHDEDDRRVALLEYTDDLFDPDIANMDPELVRTILLRLLAFVDNEAAFPPLAPHRWNAVDTPMISTRVIKLADAHRVTCDHVFAELGALGFRALAALRASNCFDTEGPTGFNRAVAVAARLTMNGDIIELSDHLKL